MAWDEAVSRYGEAILPSESQCRAILANGDKINAAMNAFGGTIMDYWYWGKEHLSSLAWVINMSGGGVGSISKAYKIRVRAVAPVPVASAM